MGLKARLNFVEQVGKYVKACGKRSILETKPIGKINASELGVCLPDGTIHFPHLNMTRYRTVEEAEAQAKKIVMKQFEAPIGQQKERMAAVVGSDLYIGQEGEKAFGNMFDSCTVPARAWNKGAKLFHNHPTCTETMWSDPVSALDIGELFDKGAQEMTAFNAQGEFNTAKLIDKNKIAKFFKGGLPEHIKKHPEEIQVNAVNYSKHMLLNDLCNEIEKLESTLGRELTSDETAILEHLSNKKILPKIGIEYKTNFSNLLKYDA